MVVTTDRFPHKNSWALRNLCDGSARTGGPYAERERDYREDLCVEHGKYTFAMYDSIGDGMSGLYGDGAYEVFYEGERVASGGTFTFEESTTFGHCDGEPTVSPTESRAPTKHPTPATTRAPTKNPTVSNTCRRHTHYFTFKIVCLVAGVDYLLRKNSCVASLHEV